MMTRPAKRVLSLKPKQVIEPEKAAVSIVLGADPANAPDFTQQRMTASTEWDVEDVWPDSDESDSNYQRPLRKRRPDRVTVQHRNDAKWN